MRRIALRNSIVILVLCLFACLIFASAETDALCTEPAVLNGKLTGYTYSFDMGQKSYKCDSITFKLYNEVQLGIPTTANTIVVGSDDIVINDGHVTVNLEPYCTQLFGNGNTVYCKACYHYAGIDYKDFLVFRKIAVVEKLNIEATEDNVFVYGIDSVTTLDVEDFDIKKAIKIGEGNEYIAKYLLNKNTIVSQNSTAEKSLVWVDNTTTIHAGEIESNDSIVLAFMMSPLLSDYKTRTATDSLAGFHTSIDPTEIQEAIENFFVNIYGYNSGDEDSPWEEFIKELGNSSSAKQANIMKLISSLPVAVNFKQISSGKYELSDANYGIAPTILADLLTGRMLYPYSYIKSTFFEERDGNVYLRLNNFFEELSYRSFDNNPALYNDAINEMFRSLVHNIDASVASDETLSSYGLKGIMDVAEVLDLKGRYSILERASIAKAFFNLASETATGALEDFVINNRLSVVDQTTSYHVVIRHRDVTRCRGVDTGDAENLGIWVCLFFLSFLSICGLRIRKG